jgi:hypothetical protein
MQVSLALIDNKTMLAPPLLIKHPVPPIIPIQLHSLQNSPFSATQNLRAHSLTQRVKSQSSQTPPPLSDPTLSIIIVCPRHLHTNLLTQRILSHLTDHSRVLHLSQSHFTIPHSTNPHQFNHNYSVRISHFKTFKSQQPITHTQITVQYPHYLPSYTHTIQLTKSNILTHPFFWSCQNYLTPIFIFLLETYFYTKTPHPKPKIPPSGTITYPDTVNINNQYIVHNPLLLILGGDIETNPGPICNWLQNHPSDHKKRHHTYFNPNTITLRPKYQQLATSFEPHLNPIHPDHTNTTQTHHFLKIFITRNNQYAPSVLLNSLIVTISPLPTRCNILLFKPSPLTPKGLGLPYVGCSDSGQAAVNAFYF